MGEARDVEMTDAPSSEVTSKPAPESSEQPAEVPSPEQADNHGDGMQAEEPADKTSSDCKKDDEDGMQDDDDGSASYGDTSSTSSTDDDKSAPKEDPELLLVKAANHKDQGNRHFKEKDFDKAARSYRRGVNVLKPLNKANTGDEQVKALLVSLQSNLSMMCFKMSKYKQSMVVAGKVLQIDSQNIKALYRRALAHRKLGNVNEARADLKEALRLDPNNTAVKKELVSLKKDLEAAKAAQKKGLQKAFSAKSGSFLYTDREAEEKRKLEEKKLQKQREEEALKKRKLEWEDECVKRMAQGEQAISFEDWEKERKKKEKEERKKKEAEEKRRKEEQRKARQAAKKAKQESDSDDEQLTEAELAQFRGYKKTADGRITSYFTREQSAEEKNLIGNIAPKRLESNASSTADDTNNSNSPPARDTSLPNAPKGSAWNQAGTWEEKDTSEWCKKQLKTRLKQTKVEGNSNNSIIAKVTKVKDVSGDASVVIVGGKKRYIFDFHCKLEFDVQDTATDDVLASGTLNLPDICSAHHEELEVAISPWSTQPDDASRQLADDCRHALCSEVRESVKLWVQDFNEMY